jgi:DNA-dependent protein kinase catalytic subunit
LGFEDAMSLLKGYQQLNQAGVLLAVIGKESAAVMGEQVMFNVFRIDQECPPGLEPIASEILALSMCLGVRVARLLDLVLDEKPISSQRNSTQKLTAGEVFYVNFRRTIVQQVKFFYRECLALLLKAAAAGNRTSRLLLTALLDDYLKPGGMGDSITKGSFLKEFLQHLPALAPSCTPEAFLVQKQFFLEVLHKLLLMDTAHDTVLLHSQPWFAFIMDTFIRFLHGSHVEVSDSSFGRSAVFALKCSSIALIPFFFNSSLDQNLKEMLSNSLRRIVADHLLVRDADLPRGSNQRSSYVQMLSTLLGAISRSKSLELLEVLFPLLQTPTKLSGKLISETVDAFSKFIGERRTEAFDLCYRVINDSSKTPLLRCSILESVFGPLVNASPPSSVTSWYAEHMKSFLESLQMNYNTIDAEKWAEEVTTKICHFGLVELLYSRVKVQLIRDEINPVVEKDLILRAYAETRPPKGHVDDTPFPEHEKEWRDLHIAAYNCLAAVLTCTKESMAHFSALTEDKPGRFRWRYLIDLNKVYDNLAVETSQTIAANQAVRGLTVERKAWQMRAAGATSEVNATLSSQYMVTASLSQEPALITSFVGGHANHPVAAESLDSSLLLREDEEGLVSSTEGNNSEQREDPGSSEHVIDAAVFDQDDFDQHPCMRVILHVIQHLHSKFGEVYCGSQTMPDWMRLLHNTFDNSCKFYSGAYLLCRSLMYCF